ncbi:hypothetical protein IC757_04645 [Wenzhouxiangella sp. AB-CW3]|uniref:hypothetical protein n=1 Tax=Wenzhouxiangella sp. AB-CW3 TaxID=2771012 RepID=UPI00168AF8F2|nr:hypothetical protein [Wenzhouxiangella sp. AB-CW3]QOC23436.1 hypothetical protein IC757_04645 [Wenzhouxiangella sp. AB-CW3]
MQRAENTYRSSPGAWLILIFVAGYLLTAWTVSYLSDFHGHEIGWLTRIWPAHLRDTSSGFLWFELFGEHSPTE